MPEKARDTRWPKTRRWAAAALMSLVAAAGGYVAGSYGTGGSETEAGEKRPEQSQASPPVVTHVNPLAPEAPRNMLKDGRLESEFLDLVSSCRGIHSQESETFIECVNAAALRVYGLGFEVYGRA